jgi:hypothetical protein
LEATIYVDEAATAQFYINNVSGQKILKTKLQVSNGYNQQSIDLSKINAGVYIATVVINGNKHTLKFVR